MPITFIGTSISGTAATTYTFSGVDIGATASDHLSIIGVAAGGGATATADLVVVGTTTATIAVHHNDLLLSNVSTLAIAVAEMPSTTGTDITVTFSASKSRCGIGRWTATEMSKAATNTGNAAYNTATSFSSVVTANAGFLAVGIHNNVAASFAWTNATERYDEVFSATNNGRHTGAQGATDATVTLQPNASCQVGFAWASFVTATAAATAETTYRKFTSFPGTLVGRRTLRALPPPMPEWRPEVRL